MVFPTFFNLSVNFATKSSKSEPQTVSGLVFADCIKTNKKDQQQEKNTLVIDSDMKSESETHAGEDFSAVSDVTIKNSSPQIVSEITELILLTKIKFASHRH